jgi:hypothetical protein
MRQIMVNKLILRITHMGESSAKKENNLNFHHANIG